MKMKVKAVTRNWTAAEQDEKLREGLTAYRIFAAQRGKIVHLECGHEYQITMDRADPETYECKYCSHVPTIEEQREARIAHQAEAERPLR
jgi:hypothetical protein